MISAIAPSGARLSQYPKARQRRLKPEATVSAREQISRPKFSDAHKTVHRFAAPQAITDLISGKARQCRQPVAVAAIIAQPRQHYHTFGKIHFA